MHSDPWNWPGFQGGDAVSMGYAQTRRAQRKKSRRYRLLNAIVDDFIDWIAPCPWPDASRADTAASAPHRKPLYTPAERQRRDSTRWTLVQGALAPIQFAVFLVSLGLVLNYLLTGRGYQIAAISVVVKTLVLYAIMITGAIWEKKVFGKYLFAPAFYWEDVFSMLVIALHSAYLAAIWSGWGSAHDRMVLALAAYATYAINATQFLLKFRTARLQAPSAHGEAR